MLQDCAAKFHQKLVLSLHEKSPNKHILLLLSNLEGLLHWRHTKEPLLLKVTIISGALKYHKMCKIFGTLKQETFFHFYYVPKTFFPLNLAATTELTLQNTATQSQTWHLALFARSLRKARCRFATAEAGGATWEQRRKKTHSCQFRPSSVSTYYLVLNDRTRQENINTLFERLVSHTSVTTNRSRLLPLYFLLRN